MKLRLFLLSLALCLLASCTTTPTNTNTATATGSPTPSPTVSPSPAQSASTTPAQVTLPLLDALMGDEKFVGELRSQLRLSNEQIDSLKRVSSAEIARLRETNAEELEESSGDAHTRANEQLNQILGDDRARELASFANDYWARGGQTNGDSGPAVEMSKEPNAVPADTRVVVNIPAFRMDVFQDGSLVKSYQVGIGYPEFPLPQGLRKAQTIIFNPTWTPPDEPWVAKMKGVAPGETVKAGSRENPLGPIKIPIGLPSLIHGGKAPARIGKFASHGCVGMTNNQIRDFAMLLGKASNTDLSQTAVNDYLKNKTKTETVKLNQSVPVELRYETIVLEDDGKLHIYRDVYAQGTNTEENLRSVLEAHGMKLEDLAETERSKALSALQAKNQKEVVIDLGGSDKGYPVAVSLSRR